MSKNWPRTVELAHRQHDVAALRPAARRGRQRAPDHQCDELVLGHLRSRHRGDALPVAHHAHPVGDLHDLDQPVRHVDDADALRLEPLEQAEQVADLVVGQRRGRLVEHEDLDLPRQRLGDLHELALRRAEVAHDGIGRKLQMEVVGELRDGCVHGAPIEQNAAADDLMAEEDVVGHAHRHDEVGFLIDDADAERVAVRRGQGVEGFRR